MREGDNTYRPGEHVGGVEQKSLPSAEAREPASAAPEQEPALVPQPPAAGRREGDNTFRPADNVSEEAKKQAVNKVADGMECDSPKGNDAGGKNAKHGAWSLSVPLAMAVVLLSALVVKSAFLLRDAAALPIVLRELACAGVLVCIAAILYAFYALARIFRKLPRIEQASTADTAASQAKLLRRYLRNKKDGNAFPDGIGYDKYAKEILHKEECAKMLRPLSQDPDDYGDWMEKFCSFEAVQDKVASKCILKRAELAALTTAASPWKFLDAMTVLYHSVGMVTELADIYRRRISRFQAVRLVLRGLAAVGVAYGAQSATEALADKLFSMGSRLIGVVSAKAAEGAVNGVLVYKLGQRIKSSFRPRIEKETQKPARQAGEC